MKAYKEAVQILAKFGWHVVSQRRRKHFVVKAEHKSGARKTFVFGASPSDHRVRMNFERIVARSAIG